MSPSERTARLDLHLHSRASGGAHDYLSSALSIDECYSAPLQLHRRLKQLGMDLVTLTDHDSIDGCLELLEAGLDDIVISTEVTATFPEDRCGVRVIVTNVTESQFDEITRVKENLYELVDYLDRQIEAAAVAGHAGPAYFLAHPLESVRNRPHGRVGALTVEHIEKAALLFDCVEVRNGSRSRAVNDMAGRLFSGLTRASIEQLSEKHGIVPRGRHPWLKAFVGGSDDRAGIRHGRTWTEFPHRGERPTADDLVRAMRHHTTRAGGAHGGPITQAHQWLKRAHDARGDERTATAARVPLGGSFDGLLSVAFEQQPIPSLLRRASLLAKLVVTGLLPERTHGGQALGNLLEREALSLLSDVSFVRRIEAIDDVDERMFVVVSALTDRLFGRYVKRLAEDGPPSVLRVVEECVARLSGNLFVSLPYLLQFAQSSSQKSLRREVSQAFRFTNRERLVLVTDTFFEVNGVARTIRKMLRASERRGIDLTVVVALGDDESEEHLNDQELQAWIESGRLRVFPALARFDYPHYPGLAARFLPFLEFLRFCQDEGFTKMQISTPGPVGVTGLLAAKLLQIETSATYHTAFPEYVEDYTGDVAMEAITWKFMTLFYGAVDEVVVPSKFVGNLLRERGLHQRRVLVLDRWTDVDRFHPGARSPTYWPTHGLVEAQHRVKFVYLGRVGAEKSLDVLAAAYRRLRETHPDAHLVIIGDGPYRIELEALLEGVPATFTGFLGGDELVTALASCDAKLFPSTTDTWGNAPLEAQAAGLPVVVSDQGGPQELMQPGVTGLRVAGGDVEALRDAMEQLMDDDLRVRMGTAARAFAEDGRVDVPFSAILDAEAYRERRRRARHRERVHRAAHAAATARGITPKAERIAAAPVEA